MKNATSIAEKVWEKVDQESENELDKDDFFACFILACNKGGHEIPSYADSKLYYKKYAGGSGKIKQHQFLKFVADYFIKK